MAVFRALPPGGTHAISTLYEKKRKQGEKKPRDFQPKYAAGVGKRAQKSPSEGLHPPFGARHLAVNLDAGWGPRRGCGPAISCLNRGRMGCGSPFYSFAEHVRGHADANAKRAAYFLWLHSKSLSAD